MAKITKKAVLETLLRGGQDAVDKLGPSAPSLCRYRPAKFELIKAAQAGELATIKTLIDAGVNWKSKLTVLTDRQVTGFEGGRTLINTQAATEQERESGRYQRRQVTAFVVAVEAGELAVVRYLVEELGLAYESALPCPAWSGTYEITDAAVYSRSLEMVRYIIEKRVYYPPRRLLATAVRVNARPIVAYLIDRGLELDTRGLWGFTALHHAVVGGHRQLVFDLLDEGAQTDVRDNCRMTALHRACYKYHWDLTIVGALLDAGADINARDYDGETPLYKAVRPDRPEQVELVQYLLDHGADPTVRANDGQTLLDRAQEYENRPIVSLISSLTSGNELPA